VKESATKVTTLPMAIQLTDILVNVFIQEAAKHKNQSVRYFISYVTKLIANTFLREGIPLVTDTTCALCVQMKVEAKDKKDETKYYVEVVWKDPSNERWHI
jgi:hypothetical protein